MTSYSRFRPPVNPFKGVFFTCPNKLFKEGATWLPGVAGGSVVGTKITASPVKVGRRIWQINIRGRLVLAPFINDSSSGLLTWEPSKANLNQNTDYQSKYLVFFSIKLERSPLSVLKN